MEPSLDIRKLRPGLYTYRLTVGGEPLAEPTEAHSTISECLQDAAQEIGDGFPSVRVSYGATGLGSFPVGRLAGDPEGLADELMERVSALIDAHRQRPVLPSGDVRAIPFSGSASSP